MATTDRMQTPWEETDAEYERRRQLARAEDRSWGGTVAGLLLAGSALVALLVT